MRILVIAPHLFYIDRGSPIDVDLLVRALTLRGDTVDLVVYREGEDRNYPGLAIHRAQTPRWLSGVGPGFSVKKVLADIWLFATARHLVRQNRYDLVHAGEETVFFAMWFKKRYGLNYIYDMDSSIAQQLIEKLPWLKPLAGIFNWCETRAIRGAVAVAPVCNALADLAVRRGAHFVTTLHDISMLKPEHFNAESALREKLSVSGTMLLYAGNLEKYQGVDLLLEALPIALKRAPNLALVVAGGTPALIAEYKQKVSNLGIQDHVHFIGPWPASRLGELLAQADVLVAPRIKGINTPMKVFPYLHSGRAVLVTDLPTHTQILNKSVCELAAPEPRAFADAIVRLASDPDRRERLGQAGRRFVEQNHTFESHVARVKTLYQRVATQITRAAVLLGLAGAINGGLN